MVATSGRAYGGGGDEWRWEEAGAREVGKVHEVGGDEGGSMGGSGEGGGGGGGGGEGGGGVGGGGEGGATHTLGTSEERVGELRVTSDK